MNERIRSIAEQAGIEFWEMSGDVDWRQANKESLEKFVQLIVQEYETLLPEICPWNGPKDSPMKGWHVQFVARKHFGVEE